MLQFKKRNLKLSTHKQTQNVLILKLVQALNINKNATKKLNRKLNFLSLAMSESDQTLADILLCALNYSCKCFKPRFLFYRTKKVLKIKRQLVAFQINEDALEKFFQSRKWNNSFWIIKDRQQYQNVTKIFYLNNKIKLQSKCFVEPVTAKPLNLKRQFRLCFNE